MFDLSSVKFPAAFHQVNEVVVSLDAGAHCCVVVIPFADGDGAVSVLVSETLQELGENLVKANIT